MKCVGRRLEDKEKVYGYYIKFKYNEHFIIEVLDNNTKETIMHRVDQDSIRYELNGQYISKEDLNDLGKVHFMNKFKSLK